jgi:hypothetical protein
MGIRQSTSSAALANCLLSIDFQQISTKNIYWLPQIIPFTLQQGNLGYFIFSLLFIF